MSHHPYPFSVGQLMALYAIVHIRGDHPTLAALLLDHAQAHQQETS